MYLSCHGYGESVVKSNVTQHSPSDVWVWFLSAVACWKSFFAHTPEWTLVQDCPGSNAQIC